MAVDYERDVKPILSARCYECHGRKSRRAGFRADSKIVAFQRGRFRGAADRPGRRREEPPARTRPRGQGRRGACPPRASKLTKKEIDVLTRWIAAGGELARDRRRCQTVKSSHWAFNKPVKVGAARGEGRDVGSRNPIDQLHPRGAGEAGPEAVARGGQARADPPGVARPDRPAADAGGGRSSSSPTPRPTPTNGWSTGCSPARLRRALGAGVARPRPLRRLRGLRLRPAPAQRSGRTATGSSTRSTATCRTTSSPSSRSPATCCPTPTRDQLIATAFHRNTMTNTEGGTDDEEWRVAAVKDRTERHGAGVDGPDDGLRRVPHAQVRPDHAARVLLSSSRSSTRPRTPTSRTRRRRSPCRPSEQERSSARSDGADRQGARRRSTTPELAGRSRRSGRARVRDTSAGWVVLQPETLEQRRRRDADEAAGRLDPRVRHARRDGRLHRHRARPT